MLNGAAAAAAAPPPPLSLSPWLEFTPASLLRWGASASSSPSSSQLPRLAAGDAPPRGRGVHERPPANLRPSELQDLSPKTVSFSVDDSLLAWQVAPKEVLVLRLKDAQTSDADSSRPFPDARRAIRTRVPISCLEFAPHHETGLSSWRRKASRAADAGLGSLGDLENDLDDGNDAELENRTILATGHDDGSIKLWSTRSFTLLTTLLSHAKAVTDLDFVKDAMGRTSLLSVSTDGTLKIWNLEPSGYNMSISVKHTKSLYSCCWSFRSHHLFVGGNNGVGHLYKYVNTARPASSSSSSSSIVTDAAAAAESTRRCTLIHKLVGHTHNIVCCRFTPDGGLVVTASWDTKVTLWDVKTGRPRHVLHHTPPPAPRLVFSPSDYVRGMDVARHGNVLVSLTEDAVLRLWDLAPSSQTGEMEEEAFEEVRLGERERLWAQEDEEEEDGASFRTCSFSRSGTLLAVAGSSASTSQRRMKIFRLTQQVPRLTHLCRSGLLRSGTSNGDSSEVLPDSSVLPPRLRSYLEYR